jgi:prepilin-type processing-associated H-X9-DG protein
VTQAGTSGIGGQLSSSGYNRKITYIKNTGITCMVAEAANLNWMMGGTGTAPTSTTLNGETMWMTALAARHGKATGNGNNALTNICFFDGHVTTVNTQPIEDYVDPVTGQGGAPNIPQSLGVVFTLARSRS